MNFLKYYVCSYNRWNPFSEDIKQIPQFYWLMSFQMIKTQQLSDWNNFFKPNAELSGSIANPDVFKTYKEYQDKISKEKEKGNSIDTQIGDRNYASANTHYDPSKGLVDMNGNILIPLERLEKMNGINFSGIAIST